MPAPPSPSPSGMATPDRALSGMAGGVGDSGGSVMRRADSALLTSAPAPPAATAAADATPPAVGGQAWACVLVSDLLRAHTSQAATVHASGAVARKGRQNKQRRCLHRCFLLPEALWGTGSAILSMYQPTVLGMRLPRRHRAHGGTGCWGASRRRSPRRGVCSCVPRHLSVAMQSLQFSSNAHLVRAWVRTLLRGLHGEAARDTSPKVCAHWSCHGRST